MFTNTEDFPEKDDLLFTADGSHSQLNACIGFGQATYYYTEGYLRAARLLTTSICSTAEYVDCFIYPIIFLYRHYVELSLKNLLIKSNITNSTVLGSHNLENLWKKLKPIVLDLSLDEELGTEGFESYIKQITEIDKNSFSFRYDKTKDRKERNLKDISHINILVFSNHMEKLVNRIRFYEFYLIEQEGWL